MFVRCARESRGAGEVASHFFGTVSVRAERDGDVGLAQAAEDLATAVARNGFGLLHTHDLGATLRAKGMELEAELQSMNAAWESAPAPGESGRAATLPLERLEQIYRAMSYVSRWMGQIQERVVQLAT